MPLNGTTLGFCGGGGSGSSSCCGAADDAALRKRFEAMNVSDAACAGVVKSVLCAVRTDRYYLCLSIYHEFPWPSRLQGKKNLKTKKKKVLVLVQQFLLFGLHTKCSMFCLIRLIFRGEVLS